MKAHIFEAIQKAKQTLKANDSFCVGGHWYGIRYLFSEGEWRQRAVGQCAYDVFAEDDGGNEFLTGETEKVMYWDHETDGITPLSDSLEAFLGSLVPALEVHLKPGQVKRLWVDPAFKPKFK